MRTKTSISANGMAPILYGLGVIGALIYFIQHAQTIWEGILGIAEAVFWPAVLVYKIFDYFHI